MTFKAHYKKTVQEEGWKGALAGAGLGLATMLGGHAKPTNTVPQQQVQTSLSNISQEDLIATTLVLEARGEGIKGMQAVYEVIMNRAKKEGKSPSKIVLAPKQFSCFNGANVPALVNKAKTQFKKSFDLAKQIVRSKPTNLTNGARWYHTTNIKPSWAKNLLQSGSKPITIGRHVFYSSSRAR
jgi:spore germination cell wall hydrolase CwlJ-like protein